VRSAAYDCHLVSLRYRSERLLADAYHSFTWANELYASDDEGRAIAISSMSGFQCAVAVWLPIVIFPKTMTSTFRRGFPGSFGLVIAALISIEATQLLQP
jgi:ACS family pantothenate transporter-like MFS transporter